MKCSFPCLYEQKEILSQKNQHHVTQNDVEYLSQIISNPFYHWGIQQKHIFGFDLQTYHLFFLGYVRNTNIQKPSNDYIRELAHATSHTVFFHAALE